MEPVDNMQDITIPGPASEIPIRVYKPQSHDGHPLSALVYFHGKLLKLNRIIYRPAEAKPMRSPFALVYLA